MLRTWTLTEALVYGHGTERPFLCPVHGDSRPSASVNILKKKWFCYTCGARGDLTGDAVLVEPDYEEMAARLREQFDTVGRTYPEAWLDRYDAGPVHPYWVERFDQPTARRWRLGFDPESSSATYPLRGHTGEVLGVVRRPLGRSEGPKYLYPRGIDISRHLFGCRGLPPRRHPSTVVLVEGALDAVALDMVGVDAFAIYGARLSSAQAALIRRLDPTHVVCAFDNDDAGYAAARLVERTFAERLVSRVTWPASWGKDVGELSLERRARVFAGVSSVLAVDGGCVELGTCGSSGATGQNETPSTSSSKLGGLRIRRTND